MNVTLTDKAAIQAAEAKRVKKAMGAADPFYKRVSVCAANRCMSHEMAMATVNDYSQYCEDFKAQSLQHVKSYDKQLTLNNRLWDLSPVAVGNLSTFGGRALVKKHKNSNASPGIRALRAYHDARDDEQSAVIFDMIANDMLEHMAKHSKALVRVFMKGEDYEADKIRRIDALLTSKYGIIDNQWLLNTIGGLAKGTWANFCFRGRLVSGHYLIADEARAEECEFGATLAIRNAEDGRASLTIKPSVFDWMSSAGIIFGVGGDVMKRVHRGNINANDLRTKIKDHINEQLPLFDSCIQHIEDLKQIAVSKEELKRVLFDVGDREGMTIEERVEWFKGVEVELATRCEKLGLSAYALVMGLTRAAGWSDDDDRSMEMSTIAGRLATPRGGSLANLWSKISARAATANAEKVAATL